MQLDDLQIRVLGCLIEKQMTTPDYYPMTLNGLVMACNQSSNRSPVADYDPTEVTRGVTSLQDRGLCRAVHRPGQRAVKYRHALDEALRIDREQCAVLAVLMLRGPQTIGEIRTRTTRYHDFPDLAAVGEVLEGLSTRDDPLVVHLERRPGEKEARWQHLLGAAPNGDLYAAGATPAGLPVGGDEMDDSPGVVVDGLAARLDRLESLVERIAGELGMTIEVDEPQTPGGDEAIHPCP